MMVSGKVQKLILILIGTLILWLPASTPSETLTFQQGNNGFFGSYDTHLRGGWPNAAGPGDIVYTDYPKPTDSNPVQHGFHALLRFDIIGNNEGQIPLGSSIVSAKLTLVTGSLSRQAHGDGGQFHRMLMPWNESSTWNSFVNGVQADGAEAAVTITAVAGSPSLQPNLLPGSISFDVTDDITVWAEGAPNYGWAILPWPNGYDGWGFWSSAYFNMSERPRLEVVTMPDTHYVNADNPAPAAPYTTWETAANDIQMAVNAAGSNSTVLIADGTYNITSQIRITKSLKVQSMNGPDAVTVEAGGNSRVFYLRSNKGVVKLEGLTISGGYADENAFHGGGINAGGSDPIEITDCIIEHNEAYGNGGGAFCLNTNPTLDHCVIRNNIGVRGGGVFRGTVKNSTISGNHAVKSGGGMQLGVAVNCVVNENESGWIGGGLFNCTAYNCMITGNKTVALGSGLFHGIAYNCVIWHNQSKETHGVSMFNTCSAEALHGVNGNITNAPGLTSASHLGLGSPCHGAGSADFATGTDIDGELWTNPPSMGCDEPILPNSLSGEIHVAIREGSKAVATGQPLPLAGSVQGPVSMHVWDFGNGLFATNNLSPRYAWNAPGTYTVILTAYNASNPEGVSSAKMISVVDAPDIPDIHVMATGNDANDGFSWTTAKASIQAGVDAQIFEAGTVWVGPGIYSITNMIRIGRGLWVEGVEGPEATIVDGGGITRCISLLDGTEFSGFSVRNGLGGIRCGYKDAVVKNCLVYNNQKHGIYGGFIYDCVVSNNAIGINDSTIYDSIIVNNSARVGGGMDLVFNGCGMPAGAAYNCIVSENTTERNGGGILGGEAYNCLVIGNYATNHGGGLCDTLAVNCTVVGNEAGLTGGGTYRSESPFLSADLNCIVYNNTAPEFPNIQTPNAATNSCSPDLIQGINGNINADPLFINPAAGDYRLLATSPCIDTGTNAFVWSTLDLGWNPRIVDGDLDGDAVVDMGTYEFQVTDLTIDIRPDSDSNPINLKSKGRLPVAVLTTEDFDAMDVDPNSVRFAGAAPVHTAYEDVDADGDMDLVLHFHTQELELTTESIEAFLIGQTYDEQLLMGVDSVKIVPKNK
jgi:hypothetical protein